MKKKNQFDNSSLALRRYKRARSSLLLMMLFTVINTVQAAMGSLSYFVFSDYLAYYCALFGRAFYEESGLTLYIVVGCAFAALILVPYLLCWIFSKKRRGWLIAGLVLFIVDTLALLGFSVVLEMLADNILDFVFHGWAIFELIAAWKADKKLEEMPPEMPEGYAGTTPELD